MLKYKLDCLVENKAVENAIKTYTAYVLVYDDITPDVILAKLCLNYKTQKDFELTIKAEIQKYKALNADIDAVKIKVKESLTKLESEVIL